MDHVRTWGALALVMLTAAACGDAADEDPALGQPMDTAGAATDPADTVGMAPQQGGAVLRVDTLAGVGAYLTDQAGRALYLLEGEPAGQSSCYDACAEEWPPFIASGGTPTAGAQPVQSALVGTLQRQDGSTQVTYDGHPLYYYHDDQGPGQTTGQDVTDQWGEWYLVQPSGEHLEGGGGA